jgi:hypothetical protein
MTIRWRVRLELALVGPAALIAPGLVLLAFAGLGLLSGRPARLLTAGLETGVPLAAGLAGAALLADERALELQLSLPGGFRSAARWRLGLLAGAAALASLVGWGLASAAGLLAAWLPAVSPVVAQLTWLAPLALLGLAGPLLALVLRSRAAAAGVLTGGWLLAHALHDVALGTPALRAWFPFLTTYDPIAPDWLATRLVVLALGIGAGLLLGSLLRDGEWLLRSEDAP